ncbi:Angiopoietin-1 [Portunus trituberculatus]|uniref:Angiopoietin-1 n=1 Tax=Portunus trituberculatus TaxID=210409 RepID=A0A5B7F7W2_PORTR|nr:Angiopoietin-1 [Portunus trituberculatus]
MSRGKEQVNATKFDAAKSNDEGSIPQNKSSDEGEEKSFNDEEKRNKFKDEKEESSSNKDITESKAKDSTSKSDEEMRDTFSDGTAESKKKDSTQQSNARMGKKDIAEGGKEGSNLKNKSSDEEEKSVSKKDDVENEKKHKKMKNNSDDEKEEGSRQHEATERSKVHEISSAKLPALEDEAQARSAYNLTNSTKPTTLADTAANVPSNPSKQPTETAADEPASPPKPMTPTDTAADEPASPPKPMTPTDTAADTPTTTLLPIIGARMLIPPKSTYIKTKDNDVATDKTTNDIPTSTTPAKHDSLNKPTTIAGGAKEAVSPDSSSPRVFGRFGQVNSIDESETTTENDEDVCKVPVTEKHERNLNLECGSNEKKCKKQMIPEGCCGSIATKCCLETDRTVHEAYKTTLASLEYRIYALEEQTKSIYDRLFAVDCSDLINIKDEFEPQTLYLEHGGKRPVRVLCNMETEGGGWTVVQRREPHPTPVDFQRSWHDYRVGFGTPETEYWVGLQNLHAWTNTRQYELRIEITDYNGNSAYAHYRRFYVEGEDQDFRLHVSGYRGTAGDALTNRNTADSFTADGMKFSTYDRDNDLADDTNCALLWKSGGWWYNCCSWSNLNGPHWKQAEGSSIGINWHTWRNREYLRTSTMMIRPSTSP